jgi:hypothetical protein
MMPRPPALLALALLSLACLSTPRQPTPTPCPAATPLETVLPAPFQTPVGRGRIGPGGRWYRSPDTRIWVATDDLPAFSGGSHKVLWLKPVGSRLEVVGHRLDGDAPPLQANLPDGYPGDFQSSAIGFPTPGCWEVEARADGSVLRLALQIR